MAIGQSDVVDLLATARMAAQQVSEKLMQYWQQAKDNKAIMDYVSKPDQSPVTVADKEAETVIREVIRSRHPRHRVLGEEQGTQGADRSPFLWIVDPIDGTKQFVRGLPSFSTLIGVMYEDEMVVGLSSAPALDEIAYATKGRGAYLNGNPIHVSSVDRLGAAFISHSCIRIFRRSGRLAGLVRLCDDCWGVHGYQDFRSYHLLATGRIDGVVEAEAGLWDLAAVSLIVREAGGRATDLDGRSFSSETHCMAASNGRIHEDILSYFRGRKDPP